VPLGDYDLKANSFEYWDATYAGYRQSEQFKTMVRKSGVFNYWRKNGFPPQCHAVGSDDFACN
jgi:hypothetical protein